MHLLESNQLLHKKKEKKKKKKKTIKKHKKQRCCLTTSLDCERESYLRENNVAIENFSDIIDRKVLKNDVY